MVTVYYGILLLISIGIIVYMAQKNYENIDINYWSLVILIPVAILGYWLKTMVTVPESAAIAFCFIYVDSTLILTAALFSMLRFLSIAVKSWVKVIAYLLAFAHLFMVWISVRTGWYYKEIILVDTGNGTATHMTYGPLRMFHWFYLLGIIIAIVTVIVLGIIRKGTYSRRSMAMYMFVSISGIIIYSVELLTQMDFTMLPTLYVIADIIVAVEYDRAHTHDIACLISEQQKYHGNKGYAAFDLKKRFLSCNSKIYDFLPRLAEQIVDERLAPESELADIFYSLIDDHKAGKKPVKLFNVGDIICQCELSEFAIRKNGRVQGYLFEVRDVTEEQHVLKIVQDYNNTLNKEVKEKTENIRNIQLNVVEGLANVIENRDDNTGGHVKRTSDVIKLLVNEVRKQGVYDIDEQFADDIVRAAPMHDLGKISIDSSILCKPGRLTDEEYAQMKTHSVKSGEIVEIILRGVEEDRFVNVAFNVARFHHERWDGRGYPEGRRGEEIPLEARIMAVADVYDALVSKRCYKEAMSFEKAAQIMTEEMGSQFDPNLKSVFLACRKDIEGYYTETHQAAAEEEKTA